MFKFEELYGSNSNDVINRFIVNEYNNCSRYKKVAIYSHKQVVMELAKKIEIVDDKDPVDKRDFELIIQEKLCITGNLGKKISIIVSKENTKFKNKLFAVLEDDYYSEQLKVALLGFIVMCYKLCNYTILPDAKFSVKQSYLQKKATSCKCDPIEFFALLKKLYIEDEKVAMQINRTYNTGDYSDFIRVLKIEIEPHQIQLTDCKTEQNFITYLTEAIELLNARNEKLKENYRFKDPFIYWTRDIVLELQENDPSNKVTLLKLILVVIGVCVVDLPLLTIVEDSNSIILAALFGVSGLIILWLADRFHNGILKYTEIDNWPKLLICYEPYLIGLALILVSMEISSIVALFIALGGFKKLKEIIAKVI